MRTCDDVLSVCSSALFLLDSIQPCKITLPARDQRSWSVTIVMTFKSPASTVPTDGPVQNEAETGAAGTIMSGSPPERVELEVSWHDEATPLWAADQRTVSLLLLFLPLMSTAMAARRAQAQKHRTRDEAGSSGPLEARAGDDRREWLGSLLPCLDVPRPFHDLFLSLNTALRTMMVLLDR